MSDSSEPPVSNEITKSSDLQARPSDDVINKAETYSDEYIFPLSQLTPKSETGVTSFLQSHPEYDGRGTVIAILDTGVDIAAPGMQETSDGKPKVIDVINCTGAGDVDTSGIRSVSEDGYLNGLTGRKLKIPTTWNNPSGKYHVGVKDLYDLYPKNLKERIQKERKEKVWDPLQRLAVADVQRQLENFDREHGASPKELELRWRKEDLVAQADILRTLEKDYNDNGSVVDCVVFHDGKTWKACIDTTCQGKLESLPLMSSYRENHEYARFSEQDMLSYSVNIYENGNMLEIAATCGSHGTHVAAIAAGYFPDEPERNGVAPGAQLLVLITGDSRLRSNETGAALTRALNKCIEMNVDIINYSYGEATHWPNTGRINQAIEEVVYKYGILFISSTGNNGPCLSTVGSPGGTSSACIGVGAYLSSQMMSALYSLREKLPPMLFPWSARGPAADGHAGVSVCAPGGAITSVPNWTLKASQLQNGTSMSSPHVAGALACVISGLKKNGVPYSHWSLRRAMENTAVPIKGHDAVEVGYGLLQIESLYEYVTKNKDVLDHDVHYQILVDGKYRGIYLRELHQLQRSKEMYLSVEPIFKGDSPNQSKVAFSRHLELVCAASWIQMAPNLELMNQQRQITIKIDPRGLPKNNIHSTEILAYESGRHQLGPLFRVPVNVVVPETVTDSARWTVNYTNITFQPAIPRRHFIHVPEGADWAVLKFQSNDNEKFARFVFHSVQLLPNKSYRSTECYKAVTLSENGEIAHSFRVYGGFTLELCITKWWSSLGDISTTYSLAFHGLRLGASEITMISSDHMIRMDATSPLQYEELSPAINLRSLCQPLKPAETRLSSLGPRDLFQDGRQTYQLILTYNFMVHKSSEVTPVIPSLSDFLYENIFDSQLWMIFTSHRQYMYAGDAYPSRYAHKLDKGDYTLLLQLRYDDKDVLEKMKDLTLVVQYKLSNPINLDVYTNWCSAVVCNGKKFNNVVLAPGAATTFYVSGLTEDKLPKGATTGWSLSGCITLPKDELGKKVSQYPFNYVIVESQKKGTRAASAGGNTSKVERNKEKMMEEAVRDAKISWIHRLEESESSKLYNDLTASYPNHLPLMQARLRALLERGSWKYCRQIIDLADQIIGRIDCQSVLRYIGMRMDLSEDASSIKMENEKMKSVLVDALVAKGTALVDSYLAGMEGVDVPTSFIKTKLASISFAKSSSSIESQQGNGVENGISENGIDKETTDDKGTSVSLKMIDELFVELVKFMDPSDMKVVMFCAKQAVAHKQYARAMNYIRKALEEKPIKEMDIICSELCDKLGWLHVAKMYKQHILLKYPLHFRPF